MLIKSHHDIIHLKFIFTTKHNLKIYQLSNIKSIIIEYDTMYTTWWVGACTTAVIPINLQITSGSQNS